MEQLTLSFLILSIAGIALGLVGMTVVFLLRRRFIWLLGLAWIATGAVEYVFSR